MEKKVVILTGASSGLGRELAIRLCKDGFIVVSVARRKDRLEKLKKECKIFDGKIEVYAGDLTNLKFRETLVRDVIAKYSKIDYLINNAGFGKSVFLEKMSSLDIYNMISLNNISVVSLTSLVLTQMRKQDYGRIIHVGSVVAFTPLPYFTVYNATKSFIYGFNRSLRYELKGSNITSTVVLPARMKTGFANVAYTGQNIEKFNDLAGSPGSVADYIVKRLDKGSEVITPTFKAKIWYLTRYVGFIVDFAMKNILGPKEREKLEKCQSTT